MNQLPFRSPLTERQAGILLHPTSLPGPCANGNLGMESYHFVDFLVSAGIKVWQMLPIGPTHGDGSPYQCRSAFAGNPELISTQLLIDWGMVHGATDPNGDQNHFIQAAWEHFQTSKDVLLHNEYQHFLNAQSSWLNDYARYSVIKDMQKGKAWTDWPQALRDHDPDAIDAIEAIEGHALDMVRFEQFLFFRQWHALKRYANYKGIKLFGDIPLFISHDSADVWAKRPYFLLNRQGYPSVVAGVPPDYYSATGQRWGNPHYDWECMGADGFTWWKERVRFQLTVFDLIRIDHFRGFDACWEIPANEETAVNGRWVKVPGKALFDSLSKDIHPLPIIAEDLGVITPEVEALRDRYALPGMKILQFAFGGDAHNPYLPHNHIRNCVVYTGTHDNDTTAGWLRYQSPDVMHHLYEYFGHPTENMSWLLLRETFRSVAMLSIVPFQDVLALGSEARMNTPGTIAGNWQWRFSWPQVDEGLAGRLHRLMTSYGRC